mmetsp:Transcript_42470/g.122822  ORF Transcript_42470/g.122822 Transcript_42470/m.122822 type:complete len:441 (+) Transcript_42470:61-1383(+)
MANSQGSDGTADDAKGVISFGGEIEEIAELQHVEEARLEKLFAEQKAERGLDDEVTLATFFSLFNMWIQLYRLNKLTEALEEVVPICRRRGGNLKIQGIQAQAFTVWKQGKFRLALELFHEIEDDIGSSAALSENMGHTYSSLGDYDNAAKYFRQAIVCLDREEKLGKPTGNKGGVLYGLGLIEDRQGNHEQALLTIREAQRVFRERADGKPSSLIAKAGMSIAKILLKLAETEADPNKRTAMEEEAVTVELENVKLFEVTCGEDSPLTASALKGLGEAYIRRNRLDEAIQALARSYLLEASKDAFDLLAVMEVHNRLFGIHVARTKLGIDLDRDAFRSYMPAVETALSKVRMLKQDANAGAYFKLAGEMMAFAEDYSGASSILGEAIVLFKSESGPAEILGNLITSCQDLKDYCDRQSASGSSSRRRGGAEGGGGSASG